jgi:NADH-quinone oxidoreductase subunit H
VDIIMSLLGSAIIATAMLLLVVALIIIERKVIGRFQAALDLTAVGPYGLLQTIPDMIKIFTKEHITPEGADVIVYNLAPILVTCSVILLWAVIPYSTTVVGADLNVGVLYLIAVGALGTIAIFMAGWSSNNKYALIGALRTIAQMISYEVPMVAVMLVPVMLAGSMGLNDIVKAQQVWYVVMAPLAALLFFIAAQAEVGRAPFDLLEAESEIIAGHHIEYSGLKFGFFFVAEFLHSFTMSALVAILFLGGWQGPWAELYPILGFFYFTIEAFFVYFVVLWVRASLPRVRIDQLMDFAWKLLVPLSFALVIATALLEKILALSGVVGVWRVVSHLLLNALITWITVMILISQEKRKPRPIVVDSKRPVAMGSKQPITSGG